MSRRSLRLALALAALLPACGGDNLTLPREGEAAEIVIESGDRQNGTVGEALGDSLVVLVTDPFGDPVEGVAVTWSPEGGGSVDPAESMTEANGEARTRRILGAQPSAYFTIATVSGVSEAVRFTSTGLAARLILTSALPAIAVSGVPLSPQPALQLQDADGTPIAREGVIVTVQIASGGGSLTGATSATSDAGGAVVFTDLGIRGSPGTRRLIFAADAFAPATTPPIALGVGAPASLELAAGDDQSAPVGTAVPVAPAVIVRDADGNALSGIPVTFTVTDGGGSINEDTPVSGDDGVAAVGAWTLGTEAGANALSATVTGVALNSVVFSATGVPGPISASQSTVTALPASISASSGSSASTITVTVRDQFGNPLPGVSVTLAATGTGNTLTQPTDPTKANGTTTGRLSATTAGNRTVSATAGGVALEQTATVIVGAGAPSAATSTATVPNGQAGATTTIEIQLRDAQGNPAPGRASAIAAVISGANNVGGVGASDQGGGRYTVSYTPQVAGTDLVTVRVSGADIPGSPFSSQVQAGATAAAQSSADVPTSASLFNAITITITARDQFGNPVGHGGDVFSVNVDGVSELPVTDNGNGTYTATIAAFSLGTGSHQVLVSLGGSGIAGSPYPLEITFF